MPKLTRPWPTPAERTALVIVDMQKVFCEPDGALHVPSTAAIVPAIQELASTCRRAGMPVVYLRHIVRGDGSDTGRMRDLYPDADQVLARMREYIDAGISKFVFNPACGPEEGLAQMEIQAELVVKEHHSVKV